MYVNIQGTDAVTYKGLLDLCHSQGLVGINTKLLQIPSEQNDFVAICRAEVTLIDAKTDIGKTFTGIGDASANNVGRMIVPHIIRMAETRAKARAMRDAVNIGTVSVDELGPQARAKKAVAETGVHPSWTKDAAAFFFAKVGDIDGIEKDRVGDFCESLGRPRPKSMDSKARMAVVAYLKSQKGRKAYQAWADA